MNITALQWMRKTEPSLIDIVRTEYSTELRDNTELVPRIALNVDLLLYNRGATTNKVSTLDTDAVDDANINKPGDQEEDLLSKETLVEQDILNPYVVALAGE